MRRKERGMKAQVQDLEATECDACSTIPVSHLSLDLPEPITGWARALAERNIEVAEDDLGRPSVQRHVLGELLVDDREREARLAAQRAEQAAALKAPVPGGVPALDGASPYESMVAAGGVTTPQDEFGRRPRPNFLAEELSAGRKQAADERAERAAVERARKLLERDK
jgi:hypothetical protein